MSPISVEIPLQERSYFIDIGNGLLDGMGATRTLPKASAAFIVTNETVGPLYGGQLANVLKNHYKYVHTVTLPDGEEFKTWQTLQKIFDALLEHGADRKTVLFALGGGVVGDMTGFAAASYMRGVPFIQAPTTLLSQVDSSVGGKTGINHPLGKNMIGAFYQPQLVLADIDTLNTLPERELSAGLAEIIKHGTIYDAEYFTWLEQNMAALRARDAAALTHAIVRSCEIKAEVVAQDERESGLRAILNFGHTFGHAIEAGMGYGNWLHGEAVGAGMILAADLSHRLGQLSADELARIGALTEAAGLPIQPPRLGVDAMIEMMRLDKKSSAGQIQFVLLDGIGKAKVQTADEAILRQTLAVCAA